MTDTMEYKGFMGIVEYDDEAEIFHGEVVNTRDVITFQGRSVDELNRAFRDSVEDYLALCAERGEPPDKPFSGKFTIRLSPELHRLVYLAAKQQGVSVNQWVTTTLAKAASSVWGRLEAEPQRQSRSRRKAAAE